VAKAKAKWKCSVCNFIWDGDQPPDVCPRCGAPKEKFVKVSEDKVNLIERSKLTNSLHQELHALMDEVISVSEKGIEDNLDPWCLAVFIRAKKEAGMLQQMIKAEIEVHIGKGKWG